MKPAKITILNDTKLKLSWKNGDEKVFSLQYLRKNCPCASCAKERSEWSESFIPLFMKSQITVKEIRPVGSYALNILWEDGHNTGIYEFARLATMNEGK
jgi:DUF971 family protein